MQPVNRVLSALLVGAIGVSTAAAAPPTSPTANVAESTTTQPTLATPLKVALDEVVRPEFREAVMKVVRQPTIATKAVGDDVVCTVAVYEWLFDHPDRVALAWQRLKVPSITINDLGGGKFAWVDECGSEIVWQTVGTFPDGRVWYATGKVKAGKAAPSIPVQGVIVVSHPRKVEKDGVAMFSPTAQAYMHSDSRAANLALRAIGPAAPKIAEDAAGQLLDFFGVIANYVQKNPKQADSLLGPPKK
ncbi:MAG: hypothetical protein C0467_27445 [Planctomycetaceae bacterium]|nr:hypothetical protein [Planctomycetaceae bacterium]